MIDSCQSNDYYEHQDSESTCERTFPHVILYIYYLTWRSRAKRINNSIKTWVSVIWGCLLSVYEQWKNTHVIYWSSYSRITPRHQNTAIIIIILITQTSHKPMDISRCDVIYECFNNRSLFNRFNNEGIYEPEWDCGSQNKCASISVPEPKQDISSTGTDLKESLWDRKKGCDVKLKFLFSFKPINCLSIPTMHFCTGCLTTWREKVSWDLRHNAK